MPVAVLGSGRCGSAMIAGMLSVSGLQLGSLIDLEPADQWNEWGYFEHARFKEISSRVTAHMTAIYGHPLLAPRGWHNHTDLAALYDEARNLVSTTFGHQEFWGWKSPKASLLIPFWREVVPDLKFILCIRNPIDVAASFSALASNREHGLDVWLLYTTKVLVDSAPEDRIITHYEDYFQDYRRAFSPVLSFLGLPALEPGSALDERLARCVAPEIRHHRHDVTHVFYDAELPYPVRQLYLELLTTPPTGVSVPFASLAEVFAPHVARTINVVQQLLPLQSEQRQLTDELHGLKREREALRKVLGSRPHQAASALCGAFEHIRRTGKRLGLIGRPARLESPAAAFAAGPIDYDI